MSGQQLLCIRNVLDSAPSSAHLHLFEPKRLLFVCSSTQVPLRNYNPKLPLWLQQSFRSRGQDQVRVRVQSQGSGVRLGVGVLLQPSLRSVLTCVLQVKLWDLDRAEGVGSCVDEGSVVLGVLGDSVVSLVGSGRVRMFSPVSGGHTEAVLGGPLSPGLFVLLQRCQKVLLVSEDGVLHQVWDLLCSCWSLDVRKIFYFPNLRSQQRTDSEKNRLSALHPPPVFEEII